MKKMSGFFSIKSKLSYCDNTVLNIKKAIQFLELNNILLFLTSMRIKLIHFYD